MLRPDSVQFIQALWRLTGSTYSESDLEVVALVTFRTAGRSHEQVVLGIESFMHLVVYLRIRAEQWTASLECQRYSIVVRAGTSPANLPRYGNREILRNRIIGGTVMLCG